MPHSLRKLTASFVPSGMRRAKCVVKARCGEDNPVEQVSAKDAKGGEAPEWMEDDDERTILVPRWGGDEGVLVIAVAVAGKNGRDTFIGGARPTCSRTPLHPARNAR
jgi:hypothetical protein